MQLSRRNILKLLGGSLSTGCVSSIHGCGKATVDPVNSNVRNLLESINRPDPVNGYRNVRIVSRSDCAGNVFPPEIFDREMVDLVIFEAGDYSDCRTTVPPDSPNTFFSIVNPEFRLGTSANGIVYVSENALHPHFADPLSVVHMPPLKFDRCDSAVVGGFDFSIGLSKLATALFFYSNNNCIVRCRWLDNTNFTIRVLNDSSNNWIDQCSLLRLNPPWPETCRVSDPPPECPATEPAIDAVAIVFSGNGFPDGRAGPADTRVPFSSFNNKITRTTILNYNDAIGFNIDNPGTAVNPGPVFQEVHNRAQGLFIDQCWMGRTSVVVDPVSGETITSLEQTGWDLKTGGTPTNPVRINRTIVFGQRKNRGTAENASVVHHLAVSDIEIDRCVFSNLDGGIANEPTFIPGTSDFQGVDVGVRVRNSLFSDIRTLSASSDPNYLRNAGRLFLDSGARHLENCDLVGIEKLSKVWVYAVTNAQNSAFSGSRIHRKVGDPDTSFVGINDDVVPGYTEADWLNNGNDIVTDTVLVVSTLAIPLTDELVEVEHPLSMEPLIDDLTWTAFSL